VGCLARACRDTHGGSVKELEASEMGIRTSPRRWPLLWRRLLAGACGTLLGLSCAAQADLPPAPKAAPQQEAAKPTPAPAPAAAPRALPPIPAGYGRIAGKVTVAGLAPKLPPVPVGKDMKICGTSKADEALEVGQGGSVKNVLLWDPDGPVPGKGARPRAKVALAGCQFVPHVSATAAPGELVLTNEDGLFHNASSSGDLAFSYAMPIKGHTIPTKLKKAGVLKLESKSHPWMRGFVHALKTTAFVVTEADGTFHLDLPPGTHTLQLWHERLGERKDQVEVVAGETTLHDVQLALR
jgi:hypothetical protein